MTSTVSTIVVAVLESKKVKGVVNESTGLVAVNSIAESTVNSIYLLSLVAGKKSTGYSILALALISCSSYQLFLKISPHSILLIRGNHLGLKIHTLLSCSYRG